MIDGIAFLRELARTQYDVIVALLDLRTASVSPSTADTAFSALEVLVPTHASAGRRYTRVDATIASRTVTVHQAYALLRAGAPIKLDPIRPPLYPEAARFYTGEHALPSRTTTHNHGALG